MTTRERVLLLFVAGLLTSALLALLRGQECITRTVTPEGQDIVLYHCKGETP